MNEEGLALIGRTAHVLKRALVCPIDLDRRRASRWWCVAIAASVCVISWLHYVTSYRSIELHELFQRLYYLPIVVAAVTYGAKGGLIVAGFSAVLFLPHVLLEWHAWPVFQLDQYAEVVVFTLVAGVTGLLADRLRAQRDRCRQTAVELDDTCRRLEASIDERLRADRLVTIGRLASGIAHEIRNPLGGLLGSLEILEADIPRDHQRREFLTIARTQVERLDRVVAEFLDFAYPPPPTIQSTDIGSVVEAAVRLATPVLGLRGTTVEVHIAETLLQVEVDAEQLERALLNVLLDEVALPRDSHIRIVIDHTDRVARIVISSPFRAPAAGRLVTDMFEPFPEWVSGGGLALATSRRLVENQRGTIRAELGSGCLDYVIELPLTHGDADSKDEGSRTIAPQELPF